MTECLVADNRDTGIVAGGVQAAVVRTIVRDTQPQQSDGMFGRGIHAQCASDVACGSLVVSGSLVAGNREIGVFTAGLDTTIASSVVRDTLPQEGDGRFGRGINAQCHPEAGECGHVTVTGSLVVGNRDSAMLVSGADAEIASSVVRDTLPQECDGMFGRGIAAQCELDLGACGSVTVSGSLVAGNRDVGVLAAGTDAHVTSTVIRDTLPQESGRTGGAGMDAQCEPELGVCGTLAMTDSLVAGNRKLGIRVSGVNAAIASTIVRDTLPRESDGVLGRGIHAQCDVELSACGSVTISASLVAANENVGILVAGVQAVLSDVTVKDTAPNETGVWAGDFGQGIVAMCVLPNQGRYCAVLQMSHCVVESSYSAGVAVQGGSGSIHGSRIRSVSPRPFDDGYGYGIQVEGLAIPGAGQTFFDVQSCRIMDATLAGALYVRAQGTVSGSEVSGAGFSIVMNQGAAVTVADDNQLSGTYEDEPTWQNMEPSPAPEPAVPGGQ